MSNVSSVINHFSTSNEGFVTTLASSVLAGATTVPLSGTSGLTNGSIFVGILEPGNLKQQVFTGTVDTGTNTITGVVWTRGVNVDHSAGSSVVDYVTGTDHNMMGKGILQEHKQSGQHKDINADSLLVKGGLLMPTGGVIPFAGLSAPLGWLLCDGSLVSRTTFATLFAAIGTAFGVGDGSTTFATPNLKGRSVFGYNVSATEFNALGKTGGQTDVMAHTHSMARGNDNNLAFGADNYGWQAVDDKYDSYATSTTGTGVNNLNPYLTLSYIIKT